MYGSFRQPIGIPDDILPDAWRRTPAEKLERENDYLYDDPCPRNPAAENFYEESYGSQVRFTQSRVRGQ